MQQQPAPVNRAKQTSNISENARSKKPVARHIQCRNAPYFEATDEGN